jgi:hypothetical protein
VDNKAEERTLAKMPTCQCMREKHTPHCISTPMKLTYDGIILLDTMTIRTQEREREDVTEMANASLLSTLPSTWVICNLLTHRTARALQQPPKKVTREHQRQWSHGGKLGDSSTSLREVVTFEEDLDTITSSISYVSNSQLRRRTIGSFCSSSVLSTIERLEKV